MGVIEMRPCPQAYFIVVLDVGAHVLAASMRPVVLLSIIFQWVETDLPLIYLLKLIYHCWLCEIFIIYTAALYGKQRVLPAHGFTPIMG